MKITGFKVYQVHLPLHEGNYSWSEDKRVDVFDSIDAILKEAADGAMDVVNIKISKFGGLSRAKQARDLCVSLGMAMTVER